MTFGDLKADENFVRSRGACFGAKLVRGAYIEKERYMAAKQGYLDPVCVNFEATSRMYQASLDYLLEKVAANSHKYLVIVATHNEASVTHALHKYAIKVLLSSPYSTKHVQHYETMGAGRGLSQYY